MASKQRSPREPELRLFAVLDLSARTIRDTWPADRQETHAETTCRGASTLEFPERGTAGRRRCNIEPMAMSAKQTAAISLLGEMKIDFDNVHETLSKILTNIVNSPEDPKYRKLRTSNEKIKMLLSPPGAKQLLIGSGFVEEGEYLVLPEDVTDVAPVQLALDGLKNNQAAKKAQEAATKKAEVEASRARAMAKRRADEVPLAKVAQAKAQHILLNVNDSRSFEQIDKKLSEWKVQAAAAALVHERGQNARGHRTLDPCACDLTRCRDSQSMCSTHPRACQAILEDAPYHNQEHDFGELAKAHSDCPSGAKGGKCVTAPGLASSCLALPELASVLRVSRREEHDHAPAHPTSHLLSSPPLQPGLLSKR